MLFTILKNDRVFFGSNDYHLYCLDSRGEKGVFVWKYVIRINPMSPLIIDHLNERLFIASEDSVCSINYVAIDLEQQRRKELIEVLEGELNKKYERKMDKLNVTVERIEHEIASLCPSLPLVFADYVYCINDHETISMLNNNSFNIEIVLEKRINNLSIENLPVFNKKKGVFFISEEGAICLFNSNSCDFEIIFSSEKEKYSSVALGDNELIYFSSNKGKLCCLNPETKQIVWEKNIEDHVFPNPVIDKEETVYFASKRNLYMINRYRQLNNKKLERQVKSRLVIDLKGRIYFLSSKHTLTCINQQGEVIWDYYATQATLPAFDLESYAYIGSQNEIHCIDVDTGKALWKRKEPQELFTMHPTSNAKGEVFFVTKNKSIIKKRNLSLFERITNFRNQR